LRKEGTKTWGYLGKNPALTYLPNKEESVWGSNPLRWGGGGETIGPLQEVTGTPPPPRGSQQKVFDWKKKKTDVTGQRNYFSGEGTKRNPTQGKWASLWRLNTSRRAFIFPKGEASKRESKATKKELKH